MICAMLLHTKLAPTAAEALEFFGDVRTEDGKVDNCPLLDSWPTPPDFGDRTPGRKFPIVRFQLFPLRTGGALAELLGSLLLAG